MGLVVEISVDEQGRIVFPAPAQKQLGLMPGMAFVVEPEASGGVRLEPQPQRPLIVDEGGIWVVQAEFTEDITDIVQRHREQRIAELARQAGFGEPIFTEA